MSHYLSLLLFLPLAGALILLFVPKQNADAIRWIANIVAFAGFVARKAYWRAGAVVLLLCFFYPITLTKIALFTPFWLVAILLLSRLVDARSAVVLSLLVPIASVLLLIFLFGAPAAFLFSIVNQHEKTGIVDQGTVLDEAGSRARGFDQAFGKNHWPTLKRGCADSRQRSRLARRRSW